MVTFWPAGDRPHRHERVAEATQLDVAAAGSQSTPRVAAAAAFRSSAEKGLRKVLADLPTIPQALDTRLRFGKFAGLTLGDVAAVEPSYVEWIVRTIDRDPEISLAARVVLRNLGRGPFRRPRLDSFVPRG